MTTTSAQKALVERIRTSIADELVQREVSMFGGRSFMVNEKMIVSAGKDGSLLVRVAAEDHDRLLEQPGAQQSEMGTGRTMGPGWITVASTTVGNDEALAFWLEIALEHNRSAATPR